MCLQGLTTLLVPTYTRGFISFVHLFNLWRNFKNYYNWRKQKILGRLPIINWIGTIVSTQLLLLLLLLLHILLSSSYIITQKNIRFCGLFDLIGKNPTCV